jgi:hypothetical protein
MQQKLHNFMAKGVVFIELNASQKCITNVLKAFVFLSIK